MTDLIQYPCDTCGHTAFTVRFPSTLDRGLDDSDFTVFGELGQYPQIVRCNNCGLNYANPRDDGSALAQKYSGMSVAEYLVAEKSRLQITERDARVVERLAGPSGRVLDIGCSAGLFLRSLSEGWSKYGIEPSKAAATEARKRVPSGEIVNATLDTAHLTAQTFDLITMWDVIEHVDGPKAALQTVRSMLAPGGHLVMVTPDIGSLMARAMGRRWPHLIRGHLYYYDTKTVRQLAQAAGLRVISVSRYTRFFRLSYVLRRIGLIADETAFSKRLGMLDITVPILTGDSMQVVLQRGETWL